MLWFILIGLFFLVVLAALVTAGRRNLEKKKSAALANHERVQREMPESEYAKMGPNEFLQAYERFNRRRQIRGVLYAIGAMFIIVAGITISVGLPTVMESPPIQLLIMVAAVILMPLVILIHGLSTGGAYPAWPKKT